MYGMYGRRGLGRGGSSKRERAGAYGPGLQCAAQYCTDGDGAAIDRLSPSTAGAAFTLIEIEADDARCSP
jgi:hypothetical protein